MADTVQGVYWKGADGNYYLKASNVDGVVNIGTQPSTDNPGFVDLVNSGSYTQIDDPNPPQTAPVTNVATDTSTNSGPTLNEAGIRNTQLSIDQIPSLLQAALAAEATRYGNTTNQFNTQEQGQRKAYEGSTVTNQQNYDSNFMDSIRAGIHGLGGLLALLRGTGAAGGTAEDLARDTVGGVTANDIRGGADTQKENQGALDTSLSTFLSDLQRKRQEAQDTRVNNERAVRRESNTQLQDLFGKMAGFYGDVNDTANSNLWMNKAGELTPKIAADSNTQISPYDTTPVVVKAPQLTAFAAPTQPSVTTSPDGQVGSGIFTMTNPRRRTTEPLPTGA